MIWGFNPKEVLPEKIFSTAVPMTSATAVPSIWNYYHIKVLIGADECIRQPQSRLRGYIVIKFSHNEEESSLKPVRVVDIGRC